jgi:hypothetical protein
VTSPARDHRHRADATVTVATTIPSAEPRLYLSTASTFAGVARGIVRCKVTSAYAHTGSLASLKVVEAVSGTAHSEGVFLYFVVHLHRDPWRGRIEVNNASHGLTLCVSDHQKGGAKAKERKTWPEIAALLPSSS